MPFHEPAKSASSFPHHLILQFLDNYVLVNCKRIAGHRFHKHTLESGIRSTVVKIFFKWHQDFWYLCFKDAPADCICVEKKFVWLSVVAMCA